MEIKPSGRMKKPCYPRMEEFGGKSDDFIPMRWKRSALVAGAVWTLAMSGAALPSLCPAVTSVAAEQGVIRFVSNAAVAPLFDHGNGFVRSGGKAPSYPKSLTEDEARQIIEGEFKKAGVVFDLHGAKVEGLTGDYRNLNSLAGGELGLTGYKGPVDLDGYSTKNNFAYEFVSGADAALFIKRGEARSTAPPVAYTRPAAKILRALFEKAGKINVIVLYDPMAMKNYQGDLAGSRRNLKAQAADAVTWAKKQGWAGK
ncbi:MAG: hypothetical protein RDV48_02595 [Candidatus Eremiobacteraeota bacterium]|nr:hypothetical protein [Candidatus Eremiobacteraeota bacterium]